MKILIVDDEILSLNRLKRLLKEVGENIILSASSSKEALEIVEKEKDIEIAFIDIRMPEGSGLELAYRILTINENIFIVFQTAYEEYALQAFRVGAIDYLLKPYTIEEIKRVFERVEKYKKSINSLRLMVKTLSGDYKIILAEDIFYVKAELKDSLLRTREEQIYYPLSISKLEEKLKDRGFFRIHKSYLVNVDKVEHIQTISQSKLLFKFRGISDVVISSKEGAKLFRERFKK
ncbi:LytTR family DNA-binding domain-containing protein [Thermodesulfovibrio sp.]|jgi:two-component system LytT family response regulator|uniref:LytR/AlgR family response regulator transcription factor n=1 Tax=Thermodesulfovibrio TaxID=28261 RepID=UPI002632784D|nr:LytTR family DNA-binding domain-containing protein [Thermodesulfovibrio sp.]